MSTSRLPKDATQRWFVARTRYFRKEIQVRDRLRELGIENFVPTILRRRTRGKAMAECAAAPNLVFVHTDKECAISLVTKSFFPMEWIQDCATGKMMVVPEKEMDDFRRVFEVASMEEGGLMTNGFSLGDKVEVTDGPLQGVEGRILEDAGRLYVVVGLAGSIFARALVPKAWLKVNNLYE